MIENIPQPDNKGDGHETDYFGWQDAATDRGSRTGSGQDVGREAGPRFVGYGEVPGLPDEQVVVLDNGVMYTYGPDDIVYLN